MRQAEEKRRAAYDSINKSHGDIRALASGALSPRTKERRHSRLRTSPRPHPWLGAAAANGATTDSMAPASPRSARSRTSGRAGDSIVDGEAEVPERPGPGAYDSQSTFKADLRKEPSLGASSAFRSGTARLFSEKGQVIDKYLMPGVPLAEGVRVGAYTPQDPTRPTIGGSAAAVKRQAEKLAQIRRGKGGGAEPKPRPAQRAAEIDAGPDNPGPGAYEPGAAAAKKDRRGVQNPLAVPLGLARALPWDPIQKDAPASTRARKIQELESATYEGPAPGDYTMPSAFDAAKEKANRKSRARRGRGQDAAQMAMRPTRTSRRRRCTTRPTMRT